MQRFYASVVFTFAALAAAQWFWAARWLRGCYGTSWCGNVISDPFRMLVNGVGPFAFLSALALACHCWLKRPPWLAVAGLVVFLVTTAGLVVEARFLRSEYGLPLGSFWWIPGS